MFEKIDYRTTRALQICTVFMFALAFQRFLLISHAGWVGFAVMMIYAGFDSGRSLHRTLHRFLGSMLGLLLSYALFCFIQIDYRMILVVIPIIVFMAFFSLGKSYLFPTIFTVTLTGLGLDYYASDDYQLYNFLFDYAIATLIAFSICLFFEYFVFKKSQLTHKFYSDLQCALVLHLSSLLHIVTTKPIRRSQFLKHSVLFNRKIIELNEFLVGVKHDYQLHHHSLKELNDFNTTVEHAYQTIRQLYVSNSTQTEHDVEDVNHALQRLKDLGD